MKMRTIVTAGILAALVASLLALPLFHGAARAQYPPPTGNVTLATETTAATPGSTVPISATVRDQFGSVVAGTTCTFSVTSQPGTDATVLAGPFITDASGVARSNLNVGSTPGTIVIDCLCGELSAQATVVNSTEAAAVGLPSTGAGQTDDSPAAIAWALTIAAGAALGIGGTLAVIMVRRPRPSRR